MYTNKLNPTLTGICDSIEDPVGQLSPSVSFLANLLNFLLLSTTILLTLKLIIGTCISILVPVVIEEGCNNL